MRRWLAAVFVLFIAAGLQRRANGAQDTFRSGVELVTVGVGVTDAKRRPIAGLTHIKAAIGSLLGELGKQYTVTYQRASNSRTGDWQAIRAEVRGRPELLALTRRGYLA